MTTEARFAKYQGSVQVVLTDAGIRLIKKDVDRTSNSLKHSSRAEGNRCAFTELIPILLEKELAIESGNDVLIPNEHVATLYNDDFSLSDSLPPYCPFVLQIRSRGNMVDSSLRYEFGFYAGFQEVGCTIIGTFLKRASELYFMPASLFRLVTAMNNFNSLPAAQKTKTNALLAMVEIKTHSEKCGSVLDKYLSSEQIVVAERVGVDLVEDDAGALSMYPTVEGVPQEQLQKRYRQGKQVDSVYDLDSADGGRIRVVLPDEVQEVVRRMKTVSRLTGTRKREVLTNPLAAFEGVQDIDRLDLSTFSPRVRGIGDLVFQPKPYVRRKSNKFLDNEGLSDFQSEFGIECRNSLGDSIDLKFRSNDDFENFKNESEAALSRGEASVSWKDHEGIDRQIPISDTLLGELKKTQAQGRTLSEDTPEKDADNKDSSKKYLLIYDNETDLDYNEHPSENSPLQLQYERPLALCSEFNGEPFDLKDYQKEGVAWLQSLVRTRFPNGRNLARRGALLADDMGLGKTLQMLTFLAWCIESGLPDELGSARGPYKPILIVAPVILLQTWKNEIRKFFNDDGAIFMPHLILHGEKIRSMRRESPNREYEVGDSFLDLEAIVQNRIVITNYDTVKNYQHSFAKIPWSIIICDEAQEIKEPKTAVTWALKSQNSLFRIAMTGTPVENRLLDLWNICDFFQPGLLGSAKEFSAQFEKGIDEADQKQRQGLAAVLRGKLDHDKPGAYILRRQKVDKLDGLPEKLEIIKRSQMSSQQKQLHAQIVSELKDAKGKQGQHLKAIQRLSKLYQHPSIDLEKVIDKPARYYLDRSPKLQDTLSILHEIRSRREKVLIFALLTKMQLILKRVIDEEFNMSVDIVNGSVSAASAGSGSSLRHKIIESFEAKPGFNAIILSPDVAGVGLTITGANNVIHYGRWWNPAKEAQATDRVYRLGQTREVNVFYPLAVADDFCSFDERLHSLLLAKRELAQDFLVPTGSLDITEAELFSGLSSPAVNQQRKTEGFIQPEKLKDLGKVRLVSVLAAAMKAKGALACLAPEEQGCGFSFAYVDAGVVNLVTVAEHASEVTSLLDIALSNRSVVMTSSSIKTSLVCICIGASFDRSTIEIAKAKQISLVNERDAKRSIGSGVAYSTVFELEDNRPTTWSEAFATLGVNRITTPISFAN